MKTETKIVFDGNHGDPEPIEYWEAQVEIETTDETVMIEVKLNPDTIICQEVDGAHISPAKTYAWRGNGNIEVESTIAALTYFCWLESNITIKRQ